MYRIIGRTYSFFVDVACFPVKLLYSVIAVIAGRCGVVEYYCSLPLSYQLGNPSSKRPFPFCLLT